MTLSQHVKGSEDIDQDHGNGEEEIQVREADRTGHVTNVMWSGQR